MSATPLAASLPAGLNLLVLGAKTRFAALASDADGESPCQLVLELRFLEDLDLPPQALLSRLRTPESDHPLNAIRLASQAPKWRRFHAELRDLSAFHAPVTSVTVDVMRVIYYRPSLETIATPAAPLYLMFGRWPEAHLMRLRLAGDAGFAVTTLQGAPSWLSPDILEAGALFSAEAEPDGGTIALKYRGRHEAREVETGAWIAIP